MGRALHAWAPGARAGGTTPEIASDVWEQHADASARPNGDLALLSRCVRGIPADLSWRRGRRRRRPLPSGRTTFRFAGWSLAVVAYLFLIGAHGYSATALVGFDFYGGDWKAGDVDRYARLSATLLALLLAGGALISLRPRLAVALLAAAALGTCVAFWWATPIYAPSGLAVVTGAIVFARRRRSQMVSSAAS